MGNPQLEADAARAPLLPRYSHAADGCPHTALSCEAAATTAKAPSPAALARMSDAPPPSRCPVARLHRAARSQPLVLATVAVLAVVAVAVANGLAGASGVCVPARLAPLLPGLLPSCKASPPGPLLSPSAAEVVASLAELERIADKHGGSRSVATGHNATVDHLLARLAPFNSSLRVWTEDVKLKAQVDHRPPQLSLFDFVTIPSSRRGKPPVKRRGPELAFAPHVDVAVIPGSGSAAVVEGLLNMVSTCDPDQDRPPRKGKKGNGKDKNQDDDVDWVAVVGPRRSPGCAPCDRLVLAAKLGYKAAIVYSNPGGLRGYPRSLPPSPIACARNEAFSKHIAKMGVVSVSDAAAFRLLERLGERPSTVSLPIKKAASLNKDDDGDEDKVDLAAVDAALARMHAERGGDEDLIHDLARSTMHMVAPIKDEVPVSHAFEDIDVLPRSVGSKRLNVEARIDLDVRSSFETIVSRNVLAESIAGREDSIVIFGSHLDSVPAGPGVNDDGSGAMATLELARAFHESPLAQSTAQKIRFAWWTGEEIGLLGSFAYVNDLRANNPSLLAHHKANIDTDMIASPNFVRGIWDGSAIQNETVRRRCKTLHDLFNSWFRSKSLPTTPFPFNGRSDFEPFLLAGIPASGVITGEDEVKTPESAEVFGGIAGMVLDPCYHQDCDRLESIRGPGMTILRENLAALGHVLETLATAEDLEGLLERGVGPIEE
ncbi:hypothetical protein HK105_200852 [Polyrhizophydium stewartii]|uniref:Peptide hydrolase n=1 Tax=Polyrhizophydium stewartii TaxID=2732419 RepID=A0ABR4NI53_9FUNG